MSKKLRVKETIIHTDLGYHYQYEVNEVGLEIKVLADTNEIKEIFNLDRLDKVTDRLKDYLPRSVFKSLMKYRCNFYMAKGGSYIDIQYCSNVCTPSNDFYEVYINGAHECIYRKDDADLKYSVLQFMWRKTTKEEE